MTNEENVRSLVRKILLRNSKKTKSRDNILYLHGLGGSPEKDQVLKLRGLKIIAPKLSYVKDKDLFHKLCKIVEEKNIKGVVGHSFGGYFAYYLSQKYGLPSLLFAPSFDDEDREIQPKPKDIKRRNYDVKKIAVICVEDEAIVEKDKQMSELQKDKYEIHHEKIGHDIPIKIKMKYYNDFINEL